MKKNINTKKYTLFLGVISLVMVLSFVLPKEIEAKDVFTRFGDYVSGWYDPDNGSGNHSNTSGNGLSVSCFSNVGSAQLNSDISWGSNVYGGNGTYSYSWSGSENLSGSSAFILKSYVSTGSKNATLRVTSGGKTTTANCGSVNIYQDGGNGNGYGNYGGNDNSGYFDFHGGYTVTSGSYIPGNGSYYYNNGYSDYGQLNGTCSAGVTNTQVGGTVTWTATASGGNGFYNYYWTGDEGLSSSGQYASKVYAYNGAKNVTVTITSNGQSITRTCSITVGSANKVLSYVKTNNIPLTASVLLSDVPYTGAGDVIRVISFIFGLILWSLFVTYLVFRRKFEKETVAISVSGNPSKESANGDKIIADFSKAIETERKEIESVEDYARMNKVLLSNDAVIKVVKLSKLGKANANDLIRKMSGSDWVSVGETEVEKYV